MSASADPRNWSDPSARCDGDEPWHGTRVGYQHHRCRGDACREANAAYARERRTGSAAPPAVAWVQHGRQSTYPLSAVWLPDTLTLGEYLEARA